MTYFEVALSLFIILGLLLVLEVIKQLHNALESPRIVGSHHSL